MTSSVLRTSSPKGEDSSREVSCANGLLSDIKSPVQRASPFGEVGGVGFVHITAVNFG